MEDFITPQSETRGGRHPSFSSLEGMLVPKRRGRVQQKWNITIHNNCTFSSSLSQLSQSPVDTAQMSLRLDVEKSQPPLSQIERQPSPTSCVPRKGSQNTPGQVDFRPLQNMGVHASICTHCPTSATGADQDSAQATGHCLFFFFIFSFFPRHSALKSMTVFHARGGSFSAVHLGH